ncbi:Omp28-related outer membrane protein [Rurimicrobium arvi]|uniref:Outer membrane protein Omp28 n=1 Tax=Rurimicrobium arvi TaxID=2049916 RepID=A0ABP8MMH2_9BACT
MKKITGAALLTLGFFAQSCKEKGVVIDFRDRGDIVDTTYMSAVETAESRKVLIEEFTGASCTNCPDGHKLVASLQASYPDRIVAVAYHTYFPGPIFQPVKTLEVSSKYDFRDSAATNIGTTIYGTLGSIPIAGIDRVPYSGSLKVDKTNWSAQSTNRMAVAAPVNLHLTSSYNSSENIVSLSVKVVYTKQVSTKNALTIGVAESNIIDAQKFPDADSPAYQHNHVLRELLTFYSGNSIIDSISVKAPGRVYEYYYKFTPKGAWNLDNCHIFAFISNNEADNKEVLQAAEVPLK